MERIRGEQLVDSCSFKEVIMTRLDRLVGCALLVVVVVVIATHIFRPLGRKTKDVFCNVANQMDTQQK